MYTRTNTVTHMHTHTCAHTLHIHTYIHTCIHAYHVRTHKLTHTYGMHTHTHIHHTHTYTHKCAHAPHTRIHQHILITLSFSMCSKAYHSLVQLLMEKEASRDMASKEQAWHIFVEALECISQCNNVNNYIHTYIHFVNIEMRIV